MSRTAHDPNLHLLGSPINHATQTQHDRAVLHAEVRSLVKALRMYRVLRRDALARVSGAAKWHEASFERALNTAVDFGQIKELPFEFYALPEEGE